MQGGLRPGKLSHRRHQIVQQDNIQATLLMS